MRPPSDPAGPVASAAGGIPLGPAAPPSTGADWVSPRRYAPPWGADPPAGVLRGGVPPVRRAHGDARLRPPRVQARAGTAGEAVRRLDDRRELRLLDPSRRLSAACLCAWPVQRRWWWRTARPGSSSWNIGPNIYGVPGLEGARCGVRPEAGRTAPLVEPPWRPCAPGRPAWPAWWRRRRQASPRRSSDLARRIRAPAKLGGTPALRPPISGRPRECRRGGRDSAVSVADLSEVHGGAGGLWVDGDRTSVWSSTQFVSAVPAGGRAVACCRARRPWPTPALFVPEASCCSARSGCWPGCTETWAGTRPRTGS